LLELRVQALSIAVLLSSRKAGLHLQGRHFLILKITLGKTQGLEAMSRSGVIAAAAIDHRSPLTRMIAGARGVEESAVTPAMVTEFKTAVTRVLTPHATAILLDPEMGLPAAQARARNVGLLLAYEQTYWDHREPGMFPRLLGNWSVRKLKAAGANGIKVLLFYNPLDDAALNERKRIWVERIGAECAAEDIPYFLEFVGYDLERGADTSTAEYARMKPKIVIESIAEFSKPEYRADVLKVEMPVNLKFVEGTESFKGQRAQSRGEAMECFQQASEAAKKPFIYLSAGVSDAEFLEGLRMAGEARARFSGVLCGRATWMGGVPVYAKDGLAAFEDFLNTRGVANITAINDCLKTAVPWYSL